MSVSKHLGVAEPWPPFCWHWKLELVDRESTRSDGHSAIGVSTAKVNVHCVIINLHYMYTTNMFTSPLKKVLSCIPVNPDSDVVFHQLRDNRQDSCGSVNPASENLTENGQNYPLIMPWWWWDEDKLDFIISFQHGCECDRSTIMVLKVQSISAWETSLSTNHATTDSQDGKNLINPCRACKKPYKYTQGDRYLFCVTSVAEDEFGVGWTLGKIIQKPK
jgi:hypothetical protein